MPEFLINDAAFWLSKLNESAFNTHFTAGADYIKLFNANPFYLLPEMEKSTDANRPGNGHEFATFVCNRYWSHTSVILEDEVNVEHAGRLLLRANGGTVTDTLLETGVTKHSNAMLPIASGRQQPSSDFISFEGGASYLFAGGVVESYRLSQNRADPPRFQCNMVYSGKHVRPHGVTSLPTTASIIQCLDGNQSLVQWTDDGGLRNFATLGRVRSWFCDVALATKLNDRAPGDPSTLNGTDGVAAYVRKMLHGPRVVTAQIVQTLTDDVYEWLRMANNQVITDATFSARGPLIGATQRAALTMIIPNSRILNVTSGQDDGDATITTNLVGFFDSTTGGALEAECVNNTATLFR